MKWLREVVKAVSGLKNKETIDLCNKECVKCLGCFKMFNLCQNRFIVRNKKELEVICPICKAHNMYLETRECKDC